MYITITTSQVPPSQLEKVEAFLKEFSPRFKQQPGVISIYHYARPEFGDESTIVIWKDQKSVKAYREGELIKEAMAFEEKLNLKSTREGYPLIF